MTAREVERLEDLLNELGWAYIEVGTGASDMQTSDDVERLTKEITDMFASLRGMREALERIGRPRDCGCVPCRGQCTSQEALLIEAEAMRDLALAALSGIEPGDEQARSASHRSAPASTLSKDTTK
jgi:hypothetical protein